MDLLSYFLTPQTGGLIVAAAVIAEGIKRIRPGIKQFSVIWHVLPMFPIVVAAGLALLPGVLEGPWGSKIVHGIIAGGVASLGYHAITRSVTEIQAKRASMVPPPTGGNEQG